MINPTYVKQAEKIGVSLSEDKETGRVDAHWVERNVHAIAMGVKPALAEMAAIQKIAGMGDYRIINKPSPDDNMVLVFNADRSLVLDREGATPRDTLMLLETALDAGTPWKTTAVPTDGGQAYKEGFTADSNPFRDSDGDPVEYDAEGDAEKWDEQWDAAADAATGEDEPEPGGSVVKQEYRIRYAERGHPNHCGDWLATVLNDLVLGKSKTDVEKFELICNANGVDMSKYNRTSAGWQGRFRMTGRNLLARRIYLANGVLILPVEVRPDAKTTELRAPPEWMAQQRFKMPKAELAQADKQKAA